MRHMIAVCVSILFTAAAVYVSAAFIFWDLAWPLFMASEDRAVLLVCAVGGGLLLALSYPESNGQKK